jgi:hypothetical protein
MLSILSESHLDVQSFLSIVKVIWRCVEDVLIWLWRVRKSARCVVHVLSPRLDYFAFLGHRIWGSVIDIINFLSDPLHTIRSRQRILLAHRGLTGHRVDLNISPKWVEK